MDPQDTLNSTIPDLPLNCRLAIIDLPEEGVLRFLLHRHPALRCVYVVDSSSERMARFRNNPVHDDLCDDPRLRWIVTASPETLDDQMRAAFEPDTLFFVEGRVGVCLSDTFRRRAPVIADRLESALLERTRTVIQSVALRSTHGWHMLENMILNIHRLYHEHTVDELRGRFKGSPSIIVGAGPALDRNIHVLAEFAGKVPIIACDAAWSSLDRAGITPDFVVSTDDGDLVWRFWATLSERQKAVPLVCLLQSSWSVVRQHPGPIYVGRRKWPADAQIEHALGRHIPVFDTGQCVGHAAFELACLMNTGPIIMMGFNLAYEGDRFHPRDMGAPVFHDLPPDAENILTVEDIHGNLIRTEISLYTYLQEFERRIARCGRPVWDATEAGARKAGARIVELRTALTEAIARLPAGARVLPSDGPAVSVSPERLPVHTALRRWRTDSSTLFYELTQAIAEGWLPSDTGPIPYPFLAAHPEIITLLDGVSNPIFFAEFQFTWDRWVATSDREPGVPPDLVHTAMRYLRDLRHGVALLMEALQPRTVKPGRILAVARTETPPAVWHALLQILKNESYDVTPYTGDCDNIPAVWRELRLIESGIVLTLDNALFPAAWHLPNTICVDVRTTPPDPTIQYVLAENWMRGYAAVCVTPPLADMWRARIPADRPVGCMDVPGRVRRVSASGGDVLSWTDWILAVRTEIQPSQSPRS